VSTWTVRVPWHPTEPVDISTDDAEFRGVYAALGPGQKLYTMIDALKWVSYRMTAGDTIETVQLPLTCPGCGEECTGTWVDFGIGGYEYWGATGVDVQMAYVSTCCEAALPEPQRSEP
jgi:hypothetical protein